jgi:hypothetical protein
LTQQRSDKVTTAENTIWRAKQDTTGSIIHAAGVRKLRYQAKGW